MSEMEAEQVELSDGVALLLQRMESHPEEFKDPALGKWNHVLSVVEERIFNPQGKRRAEPWMSDEEVRAIWSGYTKLKQKSFHSFVMKKLLDDTPTEEEILAKAPRVVTQGMMHNTITSLQPGAIVPRPNNGLDDTGSYFAPIKKIFGMK
jgi:hypothetical protein